MASEFRARREGESVKDYRVKKEAWKRRQDAKAQEGSKADGDARPTKLEGEKTAEYRARVTDWREAPGSEKEITTLPIVDFKGRDATHYVDNSASGYDKYVEITEENNPYTKALDAFDTTATGAGADKGTARYGASDMRSHLAAGKTKEEIVDYATSLGDDVKMGSAADKLLEKYKQDIIRGADPITEDPKDPEDDTGNTTITDNSVTDNSVDNSINDSYNKKITDSYNKDKSINNSYNKTIDKSNSGIQGNKLDNGSAISMGGQAMGGNSSFVNKNDNSFKSDIDVKGDNINIGYQGVNLQNAVDGFQQMTQYAGPGGYEAAINGASELLKAGASGELAINGNPYSSVVGDYNVPKPLTVASNSRDEATYMPLFLESMGNTYMNKLFGSKGA